MSASAKVGCWASSFLVLFAACAASANSLSALRSFGFVPFSAANPCAELIEASDGMLYGTSVGGGTGDKGAVFRLTKDGTEFLVIKSFGTAPNDGERPFATIIEGNDSALYGVTEEGGEFGFGAIFKIDKSGTNFTVLKHFAGSDGAYPEARLLQASDGLLYGTTSGGGSGTNDYGVIFRIATNGTGFQVVKEFAITNGANPAGGLIEGADGALYGTTCFGGGTNLVSGNLSTSTNVGTVFRLNKDGSDFTLLKHFFRWTSGQSATLRTNGCFPRGELIQGTNGMLYGTTSAGGLDEGGTVYMIGTDGDGFSFLRSLTNSVGGAPLSGLVLASDGFFYGTAFDGGVSNSGVVFSIGHDGSGFTTVASLTNGQGCAATVLEGSDGYLYGTTQLGGDSGDGTVFKIQKSGAGFSIIKSLSASGWDGESGYAGILAGRDGSLYGNTRLGGEFGAGMVFSIDPFGLGHKVLSSPIPDGAANPVAALIEGTNGWLYGTSAHGGISNRGTVFSMSKDGLGFSVLHNFSESTDGLRAYAPLVQATNGLLYGLTAQGGGGNRGLLFRINPDGDGYTALRSFSTDGMNPFQGLIQASDGQFYGAAYITSSPLDGGCVFKLDSNGSNYTVLKSFNIPLMTGANPMSPLLEGSDGLLYGTTYAGGTTNNAGAIYRLNKDGSNFQLLRAFVGVSGDGRHPSGNLVESAGGALYGTTERGGIHDQGALVRINKDGSGYAVLASFDSSTGQYPRGGLALGPDEALYGTTDQGGSLGSGTIFRFGTPIESIVSAELLGAQPNLICFGLPGTNYWIEYTTQVGSTTTWTPLYSTNAPADGRFAFLDSNPLTGQAFYRLRRSF